MKYKSGYTKTTLCGIPYLIPYGQNITEHSPELMLNSTGLLIWDAICDGMDKTQILDMLAKKYSADESDIPDLASDLNEYLHMLMSLGLLEREQPNAYVSGYTEKYYTIGRLLFSFDGPDSIYEKFFKAFSCQNSNKDNADQNIHFYKGKPSKRLTGTVLIRNDDIIIIATGEYYIFTFPNEYGIYEMQVKNDGSIVNIYCHPILSKEHEDYIFHALRFAFLIIAQQNNLYVIHSASILYNEQAWLFSGCSGTGKSTHTKLWNTLYNTPYLNGDLNIIGFDGDTPVTYGLPWCGTSGIYTTESYPLGGITFLKKSSENKVVIPSEDKKALSLMQRLISPAWNLELMLQNLRFSEAMTKKSTIFQLYCTKEPEAASVMKSSIDKLLESQLYC